MIQQLCSIPDILYSDALYRLSKRWPGIGVIFIERHGSNVIRIRFRSRKSLAVDPARAGPLILLQLDYCIVRWITLIRIKLRSLCTGPNSRNRDDRFARIINPSTLDGRRTSGSLGKRYYKTTDNNCVRALGRQRVARIFIATHAD